MGYTTERICGAGKALSGPDAGGETTKRKTRSTDLHGGEQEGHAERSTKKVAREGFEEFKELEEQRAKEALELVEKKHMLIKWESEMERARMMQRLGGSRAIKQWNDARDNVSVESCSPSMACDVEEVSSESSRKTQDKEDTHVGGSVDRCDKRKSKRGVEAGSRG